MIAKTTSFIAPPRYKDTFIGKIMFYSRMIIDLQLLTIFNELKHTLPRFYGKVLDLGCGHSPYSFLLNKKNTHYYGVDIEASKAVFQCNNPDVILYDGNKIPFEDDMFNGVICSEVLEHVCNYQKLIDEIYRVMKPGAVGVITVPWSVRYHYELYDFFRYTPCNLKILFKQFRRSTIKSRGTDLSTIASKLIIYFIRGALKQDPLYRWPLKALLIAFSPIFFIAIMLGHISLLFNFGNKDDPLGYTVIIEK